MKRAWMLGAASAILFSFGCQNSKPELVEDFSDLNGVNEKSDQFSKKMTWDPLESTCRHASLSIL